MASIRLTKAAVEKLPAPDPSGKQKLHWDAEKHGLGVLCSGVSNSKSWVVQIGKSRRYTLGPCNVLDPAEAWEKAKPLVSAIYAGVDPKAEKKRAQRASATVADVLAAYIAQDRLSPRSVSTYRSLATNHLAPWLDRPLRSITPDDVERRFAEISRDVVAARAAGKSRGGANVTGQGTANAVMTLFRALWTFQAERDESLGRNPTGRLKKSWHKLEPRDRRIWDDELPKFYQAVMALQNIIVRDLILFAMYTGTREREAAGLRWSEVDLPHRVIKLPASRMKGAKSFTLPMSTQVHDLLVAVQARGRESDFVFPGNGQSGHCESFGLALETISAIIGTKVSPHDIRRSYISIAETCPIPPAASRLLVAHSTGSDVHAGYIHLPDKVIRAAAQIVCDRIAELCGIAPVEAANVARVG